MIEFLLILILLILLYGLGVAATYIFLTYHDNDPKAEVFAPFLALVWPIFLYYVIKEIIKPHRS